MIAPFYLTMSRFVEMLSLVVVCRYREWSTSTTSCVCAYCLVCAHSQRRANRECLNRAVKYGCISLKPDVVIVPPASLSSMAVTGYNIVYVCAGLPCMANWPAVSPPPVIRVTLVGVRPPVVSITTELTVAVGAIVPKSIGVTSAVPMV